MANNVENQMINDVAYNIVAEIAPDELPLFEDASEEYFSNPKQFLKTQKKSKERMLGFAGPEVTQVITYISPFVFPILKEVLKYLGEEFKNSEAVASLFKKFHHTKGNSQATIVLTPEQVKRVGDIILETSHALQLPDDKANVLFYAIKGAFVAA